MLNSVAKYTGVNGESLQGYNPKLDFTKLQESQPICYSEGKSPNFKPNKNSDGSYKVKKVKVVLISAKYYPLSINDINNYNKNNKNNFGRKGCAILSSLIIVNVFLMEQHLINSILFYFRIYILFFKI